ncbi:YbaB/EbfC family nucleoid-associated protein [Candidatus Puniceispirillum sp.]|jgi:nucleoid-associated protein EbfC|uniref:YbaB/EbfC family nucleoid-associated protein n=1 Tax=Candidatus Puniceispirillum sp. TaxID=2026719 RepID=UPI001EC82F27|nr:YbaB/EbfC family nucleoid-associated protein [Candidatus Puniceispirillum sp.]MBT6565806.1 YbaB/EbfC family nucleoid-associated protein [Candidatus Puniceispirillum sp.]
MRNMMGMMKKAQEVQSRMQTLQDEMAAARFSASVGGNAVTVTVNGKGQLEAVKIEPEALANNDSDMLEDLILLASNRAREDAATSMKAQMTDITGGLELPPGMNLPF